MFGFRYSDGDVFWHSSVQSQGGFVFPKVIFDIWKKLRKVSNYFKVRYVKKYQYHIVRTDLPPSYYDQDYIMLWACMKILESYVDERGGEQGLASYIEMLKQHFVEQYKSEQEIMDIYQWWVKRRISESVVLDQGDDDQTMFMRLAAIRPLLWV